MTEAEWLICGEPDVMLDTLRGTSTDRKFRLFSCACCRRIWHLLDPAISGSALPFWPRDLVEIAERYADGHVSDREMDAANPGGAGGYYSLNLWHPAGVACNAATFVTARDAPWIAPHLAQTAVRALCALVPSDPDEVSPSDPELEAAERATQSHLLRDIFGNPFRSASFSPEWRTSTILALAQDMYDAREFSAMPILADALQDAGCENDDILDHCRGLGPHVRGCWVVDAVLNKQ